MNEKFQTTEIGDFPFTWEIDRVDSAFEIQQGKQVSKKNREGNNQRPFLRTKNILWDRFELADLDQMHFTETEEHRLQLRPNDLLTCEGGDIGRTALWSGEIEDCYYQNHLHRLRVLDGKADAQFSVYWFWYAFQVAKLYFGRGNVTTIPNLSRSKLAELPMAFPPLPEQKKIAHILSTIQQAIQAQEKIIQTTTELKKALMHKLFTEGTRGEPQKETEIGLIPESWEVVPFGRFVALKNGINFTRYQKGQRGILTIDVLNMYGRGCTVSMDKLYRVNKDVANTDYILHPGDLLFVRSSLKLEGVGWTSLFEGHSEPATYCGFIIRARLNNHIEFTPRFLAYYFRTDSSRNKLISRGAKVAITNINQGMLNSILVPKPSIAEQKEIADTIDWVDCKIEIHMNRKTLLQDIFRTLLHKLMTAKTRVVELNMNAESFASHV